MKLLKNLFLVLLISLGSLVLEEPLTAFALYAKKHFTTLRGDWASSGIHNRDFIPDIIPQDNPNYTCQWQLFDNQVFTNKENRIYKKISWANLSFDKESLSFKSSDLKWNVAYVYEHSKPTPAVLEKEVLLNSGENSELLKKEHSFYVRYIRTHKIEKPYQVSLNLLIKQQFGDLVISGHNSRSLDRDQYTLFSSANINVESTQNEKLNISIDLNSKSIGVFKTNIRTISL